MESSVMRSRAVIASGRFTCQDQTMVSEGTREQWERPVGYALTRTNARTVSPTYRTDATSSPIDYTVLCVEVRLSASPQLDESPSDQPPRTLRGPTSPKHDLRFWRRVNWGGKRQCGVTAVGHAERRSYE